MGHTDCGVWGGSERGRLRVSVFPKWTDCPGHPGNTQPSLGDSGAGGQVGQ